MQLDLFASELTICWYNRTIQTRHCCWFVTSANIIMTNKKLTTVCVKVMFERSVWTMRDVYIIMMTIIMMIKSVNNVNTLLVILE